MSMQRVQKPPHPHLPPPPPAPQGGVVRISRESCADFQFAENIKITLKVHRPADNKLFL